MALRYSGKVMGSFTLVQNDKRFHVELRKSNALACFIHAYKMEHPEDPQKPYRHELLMFWVDEPHLKRCLKGHEEKFFERMFCGKLERIRLNIYHKECQTLLKYFVRDGYNVQCYYKEGKI